MDKRKTSLLSLPTYSENPFVMDKNLSPGKRSRTEILFDGKQAMINTETGEVTDQIALAKIQTVETDQFVKVYASHMHVLFELSKAAQRVCEFVMRQVALTSIGKGEVILVYRDYAKYFEGKVGSGQQTFIRGLNELASKLLIARTEYRDVWYINPAIIFNGKRARFITEIRAKTKSDPQMSLLTDESENGTN